MIIEKDISKYIVNPLDSIQSSLNKNIENKGRIMCAVSESGVLEGLFTNGDFLRWVARQEMVDLTKNVSHLINRNYLFATIKDKPAKIRRYLDKVLFVPIVDEKKRLVAVARRRQHLEGIQLGKHIINEDSPTFIIAEIGNNHNGDVNLAKKMVREAIKSGANCAKFQMRDMESLYCNTGNPNDLKENLGSQYTLDLLSRFQMTKDEMFSVFDFCSKSGIQPLCTPWDYKSMEALEEYGMSAYKVSSADLTNHDLVSSLCNTGKPLICSTGMSTEKEIFETVNLMSNFGTQYILLLCNSTYPAPFKDINLLYLDRLKEIGNCPVGYSGHERGFFVALAAIARGAKVIEKHFTIDRNMEGNDHKVSLLPQEFKMMVDGIRQIEESLGSISTREISQGELANRVVLAKSLVIKCDLKAGNVIEDEMIEVKSPGQGLQPNRKSELIGKIARRNFEAGDFFYPSDLAVEKIPPRKYKFNRLWGLPVRYHDFKKLITYTNPDLLEFHLSYKDLEEDIGQFFDRKYDLDLIVHSPELFSGDHILDLCSTDEKYRSHSIKALESVVDVTRMLKPFFVKASKPLIIVNVGGFTIDKPLSPNKRRKKYNLLVKSLSELNLKGVEIIPQTMPPFPWHFGGQRYHNLFVEADEIAEFCSSYDFKVCFDVSHSKLTCNHIKYSFKNYIEKIGSYTAHLHIADAMNIDGEGLQIGDGEIDFHALSADLAVAAPHASFIPEIWRGHENAGEGFWIAMDKLESYFK
jgi:N-acetylneuraminate synthase